MKLRLVLALSTLLAGVLTAPAAARDGGSDGGRDGGGLRDLRGGRDRDRDRDRDRGRDRGRDRDDLRGREDRRDRDQRRGHGDGLRRQPIVVHRAFPLRRLRRNVIVIPPRITVRVSPLIFLPPVFWGSTVIPAPPPADALVWRDGEDLFLEEDWTEITLACNARGRALHLEIVAGRVKLDWAEIVFEGGEAQVVDFNDLTRGRGLYLLHDFRDGRTVDHVRLVARAMTPEARVELMLER